MLTPDAWLERHPFLRDVARFSSQIDALWRRSGPPQRMPPFPHSPTIPTNTARASPSFRAPRSTSISSPAGALTVALVHDLAADSLGGRPVDEARDARPRAPRRPGGAATDRPMAARRRRLDAFLPRSPALPRLDRRRPASAPGRRGVFDPGATTSGGCGATVPCAARRPRWRSSPGRTPGDDGSSPAAAAGRAGSSRERPARSARPTPRGRPTLAIEGEGGLRLDHCESCRAYLKTYDGEGNEVAPPVGLVLPPPRRPRAGPRLEARGRVALRASGGNSCRHVKPNAI